MKKTYLVIYAGDSEQDGTRCGIETKKRCKKALSFILNNFNKDFDIILGAGIFPQRPEYPPLKQTMESYINDYFHKKYSGPYTKKPNIILAEKDAWGTYQESLAIAYELDKVETTEFYIISSSYHINRIRLIWNIIGRKYNKKYTIHYHGVMSRKWKDKLMECFKLLKVLFYDQYKFSL